MKTRKKIIIVLTLIILLDTQQLLAQEHSQKGNLERQQTGEQHSVSLDDEPVIDTVDFRNFRFNTAIAISEYYDDNIFSTRNNQEDDFITVLAPSVSLSSKLDKHGLNFKAGATLGRYEKNIREDYNDYYAGFDGHVDLAKNGRVFGGLQYNALHETRESADDVFGLEPTKYSLLDGHLGLRHRFGDYTAQFGGTFQEYDYDDVLGNSGLINNDDRDRFEYELGGRVIRNKSANTRYFAQAIFNDRDYGDQTDDAGFDRDSDGLGLAGGIQFRPGRNIEAEALIGGQWQDYKDPSFTNVSTIDFGGRFSWKVSPTSSFGAVLDRRIQETTLSGASSYITTKTQLNFKHDLTPDMFLSTYANYMMNDYQGVSRIDDLIGLGAKTYYYFTPNLYSSVGYDFLHRDSDQAGEDFFNNRVFVRFGAQLARHRSNSWAPSYNSDAKGSPFIGVEVGHGSVFTGLSGPRGAGTLDADFGDQGGIIGVFGGYDRMFGKWFLGVQGEIDTSSADWDHNNSSGRYYSVKRAESYGAGLRAGYKQDDGVSYYGRAGTALTRFNTNYEFSPGNDFKKDDLLFGFRFGGGVEAPLNASPSFARMDYSYTTYKDYNITGPAGADNFDNSETMMRFGLGYRLHTEQRKKEIKPAKLNGFYAGGNLGYGGLANRNSGARAAGILTVDRASHGGTGGAFGGFGALFGKVYLGLEGEAELSYVDWNIDRDPTGRVYSSKKEWTLGGGLRAGYVLGGNTLFYGRVGAVSSKFDTNYDDGGGNIVNQRDNLTGIRFGGGIEVSSTRNTFMRMDYSYTGYDDYTVDYISGIDSFNPSETLMRFGVGYHFKKKTGG